MLNQKVKSRIALFVLFLLSAIFVIFFILKSLEKNVVYFLSPSDIQSDSNISFNKRIRVGGLVKANSIIKKDTSTNFIITDLKNEIIVTFNGILPNLFSEGKGVIAEGKLRDKNYFIAEQILAKHDENYMPPELNEILEKNAY
tara:strand:- start:384 stop:812 length:429 start_codon:yes stop_codon:yes gene_type:complete